MTQETLGEAAAGGGAEPTGRQRRAPGSAPIPKPAEEGDSQSPAAEQTRGRRPARRAGEQETPVAPAPRQGAGQGRGASVRAATRAANPEAEDLSGYVPRLKERYSKTIVPALQKDLSLQNVMEVPKVVKVVVNMGIGEALDNPKALESAERDISAITGQKPVITKAKKSIANFKLRQGMPIGIMVTIRGNRMYEFLDRLLNIALPRVRDFRGAPNSGFDGRGNYSLGMREQVMFPEVDFNSIDRIRSFQITMVTTARNDDEGHRLLAMMGLAFAGDRGVAAA